MYKIKGLSPLLNRCNRLMHNGNKSSIKYQYSTQLKEQEEIENEPIKYSTSKAFNYKAKTSRTGIEHERLWYEPYVVTFSIITFLMYFCIIREENDVDKRFTESLQSTLDKFQN